MTEKKKHSKEEPLEELDRIFREKKENDLVEEWLETHEPTK